MHDKMIILFMRILLHVRVYAMVARKKVLSFVGLISKSLISASRPPKRVHEPSRGPAQGSFKKKHLLIVISPFNKTRINDYFLEKHYWPFQEVPDKSKEISRLHQNGLHPLEFCLYSNI